MGEPEIALGRVWCYTIIIIIIYKIYASAQMPRADASRRIYYFLLTIIIIRNDIRVYNLYIYNKVQSTYV